MMIDEQTATTERERVINLAFICLSPCSPIILFSAPYFRIHLQGT